MQLQEKALPTRLGLYLHVPFCARSCDFCHFYQEAPDRDGIERWLGAVEREMEQYPAPRRVDTVFWGGGTPGLLTASDIERLGRSMLRHLQGVPEEWTVEMAPATVKPDKLEVMRGLGVTRISVGVQSFQAEMLERLGRIHSTAQVFRAVEAIQGAGWDNFNLDLMFAVPGQSLEQWRGDMQQAVDLGPAHISTYCLTFEEDTALWLRLKKGLVQAHEPLEEAAFYRETWDFLPEHGYPQYEVSNFAKPGFECRHNIDTWRMQEWLAYGPSASGQLSGRRFTRTHDLDIWIQGVAGRQPAFVEDIELSDDVLAADALIFGLRMNGGVDLAAWSQRFHRSLPGEIEELFDRLETEYLAETRGDCLKLTTEGRLVADGIGTEIIGCMG